MKKTKFESSLTEYIFPKKLYQQNQSALNALEIYKKTVAILEKANIAPTKRAFSQTMNRTITTNIKIDTYGISTTDKI